jgi:hypothetical protein
MRQLNLKRGDDVLRNSILEIEHVVDVAVETVGPQMPPSWQSINCAVNLMRLPILRTLPSST